MVQVIDHKANESLTVFVFSRFGSDIHIPIRFTWKAFPDDFMNRNFMFDSIGAEDVVVLEGGMVFVPEAEMDESDFALSGPKGGGLVQQDRSASRPNIGEEFLAAQKNPADASSFTRLLDPVHLELLDNSPVHPKVQYAVL
jgi:hypothetical protein